MEQETAETETADTAEDIGIPVPLRTQEKAQLERFVPSAVEYLEDIGLDAKAEQLDDVEFVIEENDGGRTRWIATTTADEWRRVVSDLSNVEGQDVWWLRKKLSKRVHDRIEAVRADLGETDA